MFGWREKVTVEGNVGKHLGDRFAIGEAVVGWEIEDS